MLLLLLQPLILLVVLLTTIITIIIYFTYFISTTYTLGFAPWSQRLFELILSGCIPVILSDDVLLPFDDIIDWTTFSIKVPEESVEKLKDILLRFETVQLLIYLF